MVSLQGAPFALRPRADRWVCAHDPHPIALGSTGQRQKRCKRVAIAHTPYVGLIYDFSGTLPAYASYTSIFDPQTARDRNGISRHSKATITKPA